MTERLNGSSSVVLLVEKPQGNGLGQLIEDCFQRISEGERPEVVIKGIWIDYFRGITPRDQAVSIVGGLFEKLPKDVQQKLEESVHRLGAGASRIILVREEAEKQVNEERRQITLEAKKRTEEEKTLEQIKSAGKKQKIREKPSRGMAKHIRRVKAEQRRGGIRS